MNTNRIPFLGSFAVAGLFVALSMSAGAQPTGNPKGTPAPPTSDAQKAPATRGPTGGFGESGKIYTEEATVRSRTQTMRPPVSPGASSATPGQPAGRATNDNAGKTAKPTAKPVPQ